MAERATSHELLIDRLSQSLTPVRRPRPAALRALGLMALALPCGLLATRLLPHVSPDWRAPGMVWAMVEIPLSLVLGMAAMVMALTISIAGRGMRGQGALAAAGLVWLAVCIGNIAVSPQPAVRLGAGLYCYTFMMLASVPIMPMVILALRRTRSLHPGRTLAMAGGGIAFMVSGLLGFCHPGTLHLVDFLMHLLAGGSIVALTAVLGRRWIAV